jgi:hypothetical protein
MFKLLKWGLISGGGLLVVGGLFFGRDLFSYASSGGKMIRTAVKESIPVEFEIQRARGLLEDLIPEMHANLKTVAGEEVEVAALEKDVAKERDWVATERGQIQKLRRDLNVRPVSESGGERQQELVENLGQRFERFRTSELLLSGKEKLLQSRKKSLQAAIQRLEKTRLARVELNAQIASLEGQFRLIQAQGSMNDLRIDTTKLAQTQRLLADLKKRLEVAQRIIEHESRLNDTVPTPPVSPENLAELIDAHFDKGRPAADSPPKPAVADSGQVEAPGSGRIIH